MAMLFHLYLSPHFIILWFSLLFFFLKIEFHLNYYNCFNAFPRSNRIFPWFILIDDGILSLSLKTPREKHKVFLVIVCFDIINVKYFAFFFIIALLLCMRTTHRFFPFKICSACLRIHLK